MAGTGPGGCQRNTDSGAMIASAGPRGKFGYRYKEGKKERKKKKRLPRIHSGLLGKQVLIMSICNEYRMKEWPSLGEALTSNSASLLPATLYYRGVGWGGVH